MRNLIGSMPEDGSPAYLELVRRQTAIGIPASTSYNAREQLLRDGVGRTWVADRPKPTKRPPKSTTIDPVPIAEPRQLLAPVIVATPVGMPPTPRPRNKPPSWRFW